MFVRLRQLRRLSSDRFRLTLDVVDPEREDWDVGDCTVQVDLADGTNGHRCQPRGLMGPALDLFRVSREEPPTGSESRLLWEMARAVDRYVVRLFDAGVICPFPAEAKDEAEHPDEPRP